MAVPPDEFAVLSREAWARAGGPGAEAAVALPDVGAPAHGPWAGEVDLDPAEREEVLTPLARLVGVRREQELRRRVALGALHGDLVRGGPGARGFVVGITGGVASGKSTVGRELAALLEAAGHGPVVRVATDDFLLPNADLERRGLTARKGFPESYDEPALLELLRAVRRGGPAVEVPVYAHRLQERDPERTTTVDAPAVLVLEGLRALAGPAQGGAAGSTEAGRRADRADDASEARPGTSVRALVDLGIYVDAAEEDAYRWYMERFRAWRRAAADDPGALLHRIAEMPDEQADGLARRAWEETNLPNVREHVVPTRGSADVVLEKGPDHRVERVRVRRV